MIEYLLARPLALPLEAAAAPASLDEGLGTVTPSFAEGDLFLTDAEGLTFRLSWTGEEEDSQLARSLPAGEYALRTYRIVREEDDERWHISATSLSIQEVVVRAGANVVVEVDDAIRMHSRLSHGRAQMMIQGENRAGLSIYRAGKRIPIDYRILDDDETLLTSGRMRYG